MYPCPPSEFYNFLCCNFRMFSLSLFRFSSSILLFVASLQLLCRHFKAMSLVRIYLFCCILGTTHFLSGRGWWDSLGNPYKKSECLPSLHTKQPLPCFPFCYYKSGVQLGFFVAHLFNLTNDPPPQNHITPFPSNRMNSPLGMHQKLESQHDIPKLVYLHFDSPNRLLKMC